jgi:hypothetical protein
MDVKGEGLFSSLSPNESIKFFFGNRLKFYKPTLFYPISLTRVVSYISAICEKTFRDPFDLD